MIKSISIKLIFSIWLAVSFFIVLISIYDYQAKEHYLKERQHKEIISSGNRLQLSLPRSIWNFNNDLTELILDSERELEYVSDIILIESSDSDISNYLLVKNMLQVTFQQLFIFKWLINGYKG
jgi:methyl-accepting chemotaxis protein